MRQARRSSGILAVAAIVKSRDDALQSGVGGTPTFFVNGDVIVGDVPLAMIEPHLH
jgi:protein-disulfide isomerase